MAQPMTVTVTLDLPDGVEFLGYERVGDGHGVDGKFPLPDVCQCDTCRHEEPATYEYKNTVYTVPDPATAERELVELRERAHALGLDFDTHTDPLMLPRARPLPGRPSHKGSLSRQ